MMPAWIIALLSINDVGEFSYNDGYKIFIRGKFINGEWVVDVHVYVIPYFAWGCNKFHTGIGGSFKAVVKYYLMLVINQLSEYGVENRKDFISRIKVNLW